MLNILITARSFGYASDKAIQELKKESNIKIFKPEHTQAFSAKEMCHLIPGFEAVIVGTDTIDGEVISRADKLKIIAKHGVGIDNINIPAATASGIIVTNLPGINDRTVADMAFGLILALSRKICFINNKVKNRQWDKILGNDIWGKTIGVIGTGKIGMNLIKRAKAFDMDVIAYDLFKNKEASKQCDFRYVSLDELFTKADVISIHVPRTPQTENMIDKEAFEKMKKSVYLVNTARGGIINEAELIEALKNKKIAGAALDVFESKLPRIEEIYSLENLIITPHISAYTYETLETMDMVLAEGFKEFAYGQIPKNMNIVNPEVI